MVLFITLVKLYNLSFYGVQMDQNRLKGYDFWGNPIN